MRGADNGAAAPDVARPMSPPEVVRALPLAASPPRNTTVGFTVGDADERERGEQASHHSPTAAPQLGNMAPNLRISPQGPPHAPTVLEPEPEPELAPGGLLALRDSQRVEDHFSTPVLDETKRDRFGFACESPLQDTEERYDKHKKVLEKQRKHLRLARAGDCPIDKMLRIGVPAEERKKVWMLFSGAQRNMGMYPTMFGELLSLAHQAQGEENAEARRQIELDLPRTFPLHKGLDTPEGTDALRNVLLAYSFRNSAVGYCQSMNFIAAVLLLYVKQEPAFWLLATLIEETLPELYFDEGKVAGSGAMSGVRVDLRVCEILLAQIMPKLANHLDSLQAWDCGLRGMLTQWFMMLFVTALPVPTVCRVWDNLFCKRELEGEGSKMLFRVALALFRAREKELLAATSPTDCPKLLREHASTLFDDDDLVKNCFHRKLRRLDGEAGDQLLTDLRATCRAEVEKEHAEVTRRREEYERRKKQKEAQRAAAAMAQSNDGQGDTEQ